MRMLFFGYVVSESEANVFSGASVAGNRMQLELLRALRKRGADIEVVSLLPVASFPKERSLWVGGRTKQLLPGMVTRTPMFVTIPILKQITQIAGAIISARGLAARGAYDCILTFNLAPHIGIAAFLTKLRHKVPVVCLLADPPVPVSEPETWLWGLARGIGDRLSRWLISRSDRVIALSSRAAEQFAPGVPYMVLDGAMNPPQQSSPSARVTNESSKRIVFTGSLHPYNGIVEAIEAMKLIDDSTVGLHIYGAGPLTPFVEAMSARMNNVHYHGKLDSTMIGEVQRSAFLLINPRQVGHAISDITFPSKLLEYMASGTPVLTTRLGSITPVYEDLVHFSETGTPADLANQIERIVTTPLSELKERSLRARDFVIKHRTWDDGARRILDFIGTD